MLNVVKKSFNDLTIIKNNETNNKYQLNNDEKYMSFNKYKKTTKMKTSIKKIKKMKKTN